MFCWLNQVPWRQELTKFKGKTFQLKQERPGNQDKLKKTALFTCSFGQSNVYIIQACSKQRILSPRLLLVFTETFSWTLLRTWSILFFVCFLLCQKREVEITLYKSWEEKKKILLKLVHSWKLRDQIVVGKVMKICLLLNCMYMAYGVARSGGFTFG